MIMRSAIATLRSANNLSSFRFLFRNMHVVLFWMLRYNFVKSTPCMLSGSNVSFGDLFWTMHIQMIGKKGSLVAMYVFVDERCSCNHGSNLDLIDVANHETSLDTLFRNIYRNVNNVPHNKIVSRACMMTPLLCDGIPSLALQRH